jgi:hypothetical protein
LQESVRLSILRYKGGPPLISKSWTANGRSFPLNSYSQRRAAPSTRVSWNFTGHSGEAGSNSQ